MKHAAVAVVALALMACQAGVSASASGGTNSEIIRGMYEAFARGDVPAVAAAMAPDVEWRVAENYIYADGSPYVGPDAVVNGPFARLGADWTGFRLTVDELVDAGERVVVLGRYSGRHNASGSSLDAQFAHVWRLKQGRVVDFQQYTDTLQFATAAGGKRKAGASAKSDSGKARAKSSAPSGKSADKKKAAKRSKSRG